MAYTFNQTGKFSSAPAYDHLKELASKDPDTGIANTIFKSQGDMTLAVLEAVNGNPDVDQRALEAICAVDRSKFFDWDKVAEDVREKMKEPYTLMAPMTEHGVSIPSPHIVLMQASALGLRNGHKILQIGTKLGYNAVVLAKTAGPMAEVYTTEQDPNHVSIAKRNIEQYDEFHQIDVFRPFDDRLGIPEYAPFDRITTTIAATGTSQIEELLDQLKINGILHMPVVKRVSATGHDSHFWLPGSDSEQRIAIRDPARDFAYVGVYTFQKTNEDCVEYSLSKPKTCGPYFHNQPGK